MCDEMNNDFRVRGRLENGAIGLQLAAKHGGIDQVSIVRHGQIAKSEIDVQRLHILETGSARRRIAVVSDRHGPRQPRQSLLGKYIRDMALALFNMKLLAVIGHDSGRFLSAMLERVEAEIGKISGFFVAVYAENGAFIVEFVGRNKR